MISLVQALVTVLIGAATFATGQIFVKLCEPVFDLRSLFGEIARDLLLYENRGNRIADAQKRLLIFRSLSGALHERVQRVVWYPAFSLVKVIPPKKDVRKSSSLLIGLSNSQVAKPEELWEYRPWENQEPNQQALAPQTTRTRRTAAHLKIREKTSSLRRIRIDSSVPHAVLVEMGLAGLSGDQWVKG
jgi:hypothetical protein